MGRHVHASPFLGRPLGHFTFSLVGLQRAISRNIFQRALRAILGFYKDFLEKYLAKSGDRQSLFIVSDGMDVIFNDPEPQTWKFGILVPRVSGLAFQGHGTPSRLFLELRLDGAAINGPRA